MGRKIEECHPDLQMLLLACVQSWANEGLDIVISCTWRSFEEQAHLYAQGRTKPGLIVTHAKPGRSAHNYMIRRAGSEVPASLAFDVVPLRFGKSVWGTRGNGLDADPSDDNTDDLELWQRAAVIAKIKGLEWAGDWTVRKREFPHFQLPQADELMSKF